MCIPLVLRLVPIIWLIFYIFSIIGLETFNTDTFDHIVGAWIYPHNHIYHASNYKQGSPYTQTENYADFTSFGKAQLVLF